MTAPLTFKVADTAEEREAIHALNYRTFVEEIPQHAPNTERRLVDRFDAENCYLIACSGTQLVGMVALRDRRPFSLDAKLPDLDVHLPAGRRWAEVRLLAVERAWRGSAVFAGLLRLLERECSVRGLDAAVVSATTRQKRLYANLGFEPFGPQVGKEGAWYQPMFLRIEHLRSTAAAHLQPRRAISLLPGPVELSPAVRRALGGRAVSHRSPAQLRRVAECRAALCRLTGATHAALLPGSGTLANEVVAAQLARGGKPGVVASHGEFGERLADHARRAGLRHRHHRQQWGTALNLDAVAACLDATPHAGWLWAVHCETSTGQWTSLDALRDICAPRGVQLCLDCVSSLGAGPTDLRGVHLASSTSGKALGAAAGLGIVFHREQVLPDIRTPRALDLGLYAEEDGVPFTLNSLLVDGLSAALHLTDWDAKFRRIRTLSLQLADALRERGFKLIADASHGVLTVPLPLHLSATAVADALATHGWQVNAHSAHLRDRNWLQFCLFGDLDSKRIATLPDALWECVRGFRPTPSPDQSTFGGPDFAVDAPPLRATRIAAS